MFDLRADIAKVDRIRIADKENHMRIANIDGNRVA